MSIDASGGISRYNRALPNSTRSRGFSMAEQHSSKSIMWGTIIAAVVLVAVVAPFTIKGEMSAADQGGSDEADVRIQPVAKFELQKAAAPCCW